MRDAERNELKSSIKEIETRLQMLQKRNAVVSFKTELLDVYFKANRKYGHLRRPTYNDCLTFSSLRKEASILIVKYGFTRAQVMNLAKRCLPTLR